jgi:hypothetical protein
MPARHCLPLALPAMEQPRERGDAAANRKVAGLLLGATSADVVYHLRRERGVELKRIQAAARALPQGVLANDGAVSKHRGTPFDFG